MVVDKFDNFQIFQTVTLGINVNMLYFWFLIPFGGKRSVASFPIHTVRDFNSVFLQQQRIGQQQLYSLRKMMNS